MLVRRDDIHLDDRGASWLATVAFREAWRLARSPRQAPVGAMRGDDCDPRELSGSVADDSDPLTAVIVGETHRQRVRQLRKLKSLERRDLFLLALGYSRAEIGEVTDQTLGRVDRHFSSGRATLRRFGAMHTGETGA